MRWLPADVRMSPPIAVRPLNTGRKASHTVTGAAARNFSPKHQRQIIGAENQRDAGEHRVAERQRQHFERELETVLDAVMAVLEKPRIERGGHGAQRHRGGVDNAERGGIEARDRRSGEIGDHRLVAVAERAVGGEIEAEMEAEREFMRARSTSAAGRAAR